MDQDGYADVIVGAPFDDNNASNSGSARVLSGKDGSALYTFNGDAAGYLFGSSVSGAGDVNQDGHDDVIVGANFDDTNGDNSGIARVFSGKDGAVLYTFNGDAANDLFGNSVSEAGDVNQDGYADVIIGANRADPNGESSGIARVYSGKNGTVLHTFNGDSENDLLGASVSVAGDLNQDGYVDLAAGAPGDDNNGNNSGSVRVYSGKDGAVLYTFNGDPGGDAFGFSISGAGDVNQDGYADVIVGAYLDDNNGTSSGSARVLSGKLLSLTTDTHQMSVGAASVQNLSLDAGIGNALGNYWVFTNFAASGNSPGVTMSPDVTIPLNPDVLTNFVINITQLGGGGPTFVGWKGNLDINGKASASLNTSGPVPVVVGITLNHAALVYTTNGCGAACDTFQLATNWVPMTTVP